MLLILIGIMGVITFHNTYPLVSLWYALSRYCRHTNNRTSCRPIPEIFQKYPGRTVGWTLSEVQSKHRKDQHLDIKQMCIAMAILYRFLVEGLFKSTHPIVRTSLLYFIFE